MLNARRCEAERGDGWLGRGWRWWVEVEVVVVVVVVVQGGGP